MPLVLAIVQFSLGYLLKKWPAFPNQFIPLATYVMGVLGFAVSPKEAHAASLLDPVLGSSSIFVAALAQNIAVTGVHSSWKNAVKPALMTTARVLLGRWFKF